MVHPLFITFALLASLYFSYFYIKLYVRKIIPEYYCVIDKVSVSGMDLTFYYSIVYVLWSLVLIFTLCKAEGNYTDDAVNMYTFVNISKSAVVYYSVYWVYYYHGLVNLFWILVSLDTYNEVSEFWFNWIFTLVTNWVFICWIFICVLPDTPWIYLTFWGVIVCMIIWVKGMKENFEEEDRMYNELHKAKYGKPARARPKISKKFKEDEDLDDEIDDDDILDDDNIDVINQRISEAEKNNRDKKADSSEY